MMDMQDSSSNRVSNNKAQVGKCSLNIVPCLRLSYKLSGGLSNLYILVCVYIESRYLIIISHVHLIVLFKLSKRPHF